MRMSLRSLHCVYLVAFLWIGSVEASSQQGRSPTTSNVVEITSSFEKPARLLDEIEHIFDDEVPVDDAINDQHDDDHDHDDSSESKPWSEVIIASLLINLCTLAGIAVLSGKFITGMLCKKKENDLEDTTTKSSNARWTQNIIPCFASGALLATTVFLILPESLHMLVAHFSSLGEDNDDHDHRGLEEDGHEDHVDYDTDVAWRFGTCALAGVLLPILTGFLFSHDHHDSQCEACLEEKAKEIIKIQEKNKELLKENQSLMEKTKELALDDATDTLIICEPCEEVDNCHHCNDYHSNEENNHGEGDDHHDHDHQDEEQPNEKEAEQHLTKVNYPLAASVLLGDFFHNFTDGVLVGTAFMLCNRDLAIAISLATVYHELAQEIADYFLLTEHCHIRPAMALLLNFLFGLSVVVGAIFILSVDISQNATGCILANGGGVYIYIAVGECLPRAKQAQKTAYDKAISILSFIAGAIPIGLVLLNHGHCEAEDAH